jgi:hypothetical protein
MINYLPFKTDKIMKTKSCILFLAITFIPLLFFGQGMIIHPGSVVTVKQGAKLTINNGDLRIKSTSATNAGALILDDNVNTAVTLGGTSPGSAKVERYLDYDKWHYISPPISDATINVFLGIYLKKFDETQENEDDTTYYANNWIYLSNPTTTALNPMQGYAVWNQTGSGSNDYTFTGTLNNGPNGSPVELNPSPTNSGSENGYGWNLVGNPYPCIISWGTDGCPVNGWTKTNIDKTIYFWNNGNYSSFNSAGSGTGTGSPAGTRYIPAMQGFFIHVTTGQATGTLKADNRVRIDTVQSFWKKTEEVIYNQLRLKVVGNNLNDDLVVRFIPGSTSGFDSDYDGYKLFGIYEAPQLYSVSPDQIYLTINTLPLITQNLVIPVGFFIGVTGTNTLVASQIDSFEPDVTIFMEDKKENYIQDLRQNPQYIFDSEVSDDPNRFLLHFSDPNVGTDHKVMDSGIQVYSYGNTLYVRKNGKQPVSGEMILYDPLGKELCKYKLADTELNKITTDLKTGCYIAWLITPDHTIVKVVFINAQ